LMGHCDLESSISVIATSCIIAPVGVRIPTGCNLQSVAKL
jgi:hypothetical protein